jgi:hypothetical protein
VDSRRGDFPERSLSEILNETFVIYGKHFWKLLGLSAVVHVPINLLGLVVGKDTWTIVILVIVAILATFLVYGATVVAVGQQYIYSNIKIASCYQRVWWRVFSLTQLAVVLGGGLVLTVGLTFAAFVVMAQGLALGPFLLGFSGLLMGYLLYATVAVQAVVLEGYRFVGGIRRSTRLVNGSWRRVFGLSVVIGLVIIGLFMLAAVPFLIIGGIVLGPEPEGFGATVFSSIGGMVVSVVTSPVGFIVTTLIYFDLRVRKEGYDMETLSNEMGLQPTF